MVWINQQYGLYTSIMAIELKSPADIEKMRAASQVVRQVIQRCRQLCQPGVTTWRIDEEALNVIEQCGARGLFKGYPSSSGAGPFPANLCISVNEVVVHGIADGRVIQEGDVVGIDCGVELDGWCGDAAATIRVEKVPPRVCELCEVTEHVLTLAIENIKPGRWWSQIARLMQNYAEQAGFSVVKEFVGHGIGRKMHEEPQVPNFVSRETKKRDILLKEGMVLAIEPMCNMGVAQTITLEDGWTVVTADRLPSAHYEHTVAVTANGADVLTLGR